MVKSLHYGTFPCLCSFYAAGTYRKGIYFTASFSYSASSSYSVPDTRGQKDIYQTFLLTGDFTMGRQPYITPPKKPGYVTFDSVVDNVSNPNIFVIFNGSQAYPEYLITFR